MACPYKMVSHKPKAIAKIDETKKVEKNSKYLSPY